LFATAAPGKSPSRAKIVNIAQSELSKGVSERGGVPRYNRGRGKIVPYSIGRLPWEMTFASWVMQRAGYKKHLRQTPSMKIHSGGRAVAYTGSLTAAARRAGQLRRQPRPGYLAMYGNNHVAIVERVSRGRVVSTIDGNASDGITRVYRPAGITNYIAPW